MCFISRIHFIGRAGNCRNGDALPMTLRFGITALEFQSTADQIIVDGVPDFSRFDVENEVRTAVGNGYSVIELSLDAKYIIPSSLTPESINRLVEIKSELGHSYTIHLPFWSVELATFNDPVRKGSVESTVESIKLTQPLEPEAYVLHATGDLAEQFSNLPYSTDLVRLICTLLGGFAATSIEEIISKTEIDPRKLAIENYVFPFDIMRDLIDDLDTSICFDTAHLLTGMSGTESIMEFYNEHKDRISEIHLQDGTYTEYAETTVRKDHLSLGQGIWGDSGIREFLLELVKDKFIGPIIFELSLAETRDSINRIKEIVPEALL